MRPLRLALPILALLAASTAAAAADLPPELAGLEKEGETYFRDSGRPGVSGPERAAARKKSWDCVTKAAEILARHGEANPGDRARLAARLSDMVAIGWWLHRESPGGILESPTATPGAAPGAAPTGEGDSRNPFDDAASNPAAPVSVRPTSIEQAIESADAWARGRPHDLPGIQRKYLEALTSFPDQLGQPSFLKAAERAGKAHEGLKEVYRRVRKTDPDAIQPEVSEILRLLVVLNRELLNPDSAARERCARVLGHLGSGDSVASLGKAMRKEKVLQTLLAMGDALATIGGRRAVDALRGMRDEPELGTKALGWLAKTAARNPVDRATAAGAMGSFAMAKDAALATEAIEALLALGAEGIPGLVEALATNDASARRQVIEALGKSKHPPVARPLSNFLLTDDIPNAKPAREAAMAAIRALGMEAVPWLFPALRNARTQYWTGSLLREMTGQNFPSGKPSDWFDWWKKDHPDWKEQAE